jgi:hypothetical protein
VETAVAGLVGQQERPLLGNLYVVLLEYIDPCWGCVQMDVCKSMRVCKHVVCADGDDMI